MKLTFVVLDPFDLQRKSIELAIPAKSCEQPIPEPDNAALIRSTTAIATPKPEWNVEPSRRAVFANKLRLGRRVLVDIVRSTPVWTRGELRAFLHQSAFDDRWIQAPGNFFRDGKHGSEFICHARTLIRKEHKVLEERIESSLPEVDKLEDLADSLVSLRNCLRDTTGWAFRDEYSQKVIVTGEPQRSGHQGPKSYNLPSMDAALPFGLGRSGATMVHSPDNIVVSRFLLFI
jgi:hypothetical protein